MMNGSSMIERTLMRGSSDSAGSWKIIWKFRRSGRSARWLGVGDVGVLEMDAAGRRLEQPDDGLAERGFPAAGLADEAERFAGRDVQRDAVHRAHGSGLAQHDAAAHREVDAEVVRRIEAESWSSSCG